jgi:hypothetical protein
MVALTKSQGKEVLSFILTNILEDDDEDDGSPGPIQLALRKAKVKSILDLNSMSASTLETLSYDDHKTKDNIALEKGEVGILKTFRAFIFYRASIGEPFDSMQSWVDITLEDFQKFRVSKEWFNISENQKVLPASSGNNQTQDAVANFKRGIKRDIGLFPTLKQDKQWDVWHGATLAQARAQDLMEILQDPLYLPVTSSDQALFARNRNTCMPYSNVHFSPTKARHSYLNILNKTSMPNMYTRNCAHTPSSQPRPL